MQAAVCRISPKREIKRTGSQIKSYGNTLRSKFKKTMVEVGEAILRYAKSHDTVIQDAQSAEAGH